MATDMKMLIAEHFDALVRQRGIDKVTVKAVIEDCGISRQTFYYHFQDIMDVVEWYQNQSLRQSIERSLEAPSYQEAIRGVIYEVFQHRALIQQLIASHRRKEMELLFFKAMRTYLQELLRGRSPDLSGSLADLDTVLSFYSCGLVGMLLMSLEQKNPDVDALAGQMCRLLTGENTLRFTDRAAPVLPSTLTNFGDSEH